MGRKPDMINGRILVYSREQEPLDFIVRRVELPGVFAVTAMSAAEAVSLLEIEAFDLVVLAGRSGRDDLLTLLGVTLELDPSPPCIVVEPDAGRETILGALNGGCSYFIDSPADLERIGRIATSFISGKRPAALPPSSVETDRPPVNRLSTQAVETDRPPMNRLSTQAKEPLSRREYEILYTMLRGMGNREISMELGISEKTVKNHLWKIYRKFEVENRTQLFHRLLRSCPCLELAPAAETIPAVSRVEESTV